MVDEDVNNVSRLLQIAALMDRPPSGCQKKILSSYARELSTNQRKKVLDRTLSSRPSSAHIIVQRPAQTASTSGAVSRRNSAPNHANSQLSTGSHKKRNSYPNDNVNNSKIGDVPLLGTPVKATLPVAQPLYRRPLSASQLDAAQHQSDTMRTGGKHTLINKHAKPSQKRATVVLVPKLDTSTVTSKPPVVQKPKNLQPSSPQKQKNVVSNGRRNNNHCKNRTNAGNHMGNQRNKPRISATFAEAETLPSTNPVQKHRRVQSAKARLTSDQCNTFSKESKLVRMRPQSAQVQSVTKRPSSAKEPKVDDEQDLGPHVFGYKSGKTVFGSVSDISEDAKLLPDKQWKLADPEEEPEDWRGYDVEEDEFAHIDAPHCLHPLLPWLTADITQPVGISPDECLMFLPSMRGEEMEDLPVVPVVVEDATETLPHQGSIDPPEPWVVKKYDHPWTKIPLPEYPCKHNHKHHKYHVRIMDADGQVLHESRTGPRTADIVRQEIRELEALMKGEGCHTGISLVVQYQAEISHLQDMIQQTMGRVEEIERRERAKLEALQPTDLCGLRKFYKRHDKVMEEIKKRYEKCIEELAAIETDPNTADNLRHFKERHKELQTNTD